MTETAAFFKDKTVLLTGVTGFLGKVLLEKILWQFPQIRRTILLIRPFSKNDSEASVGLRARREIFSSPIFNRLRLRHGQSFDAYLRHKIQTVPGDISCPDLGLSAEMLQKIDWEADLVINLAAMVTFDERLDNAVDVNALGPYHLLNFAKRFGNPTMLHVSTAFVCGHCTGSVPEQLPERNACPFDLMGIRHDESFSVEREIERARRLAEAVENESRTPSARSEFRRLARLQASAARSLSPVELDTSVEKNRQRWTSQILSQQGLSRAQRHGWFDTYTFTKAMGERLLVRSGSGVPLIILRPSIIESSLLQPEPGWIDCFQTSTPILFGYGKGEVPDFPGKRSGLIDFIPVDFVASAILASLAAGTGGANPKVFHVASSSENPLRLEDLMDYCLDYFRDFPLRGRSNTAALQPWKYRSRHNFDWWLNRRRQMLRTAAALNDHVNFWHSARRWSHKLAIKQMHLDRLDYYARLYANYTRLFCQFATDNTRQLFQSLTSQGRQELFFDPNAIDWKKYIQEIHLPGVRRHVMKRTGSGDLKSIGA